ncbi:MAG: hypothetical protein WD048_08715 [Chitinophagales bacterium]
MTQQEIEKEILDYLQEHLVTANTAMDVDTLYSDIGLDSYSLIEMLLYLEAKYHCSLLDGATQKTDLESTTALAGFIHSKI